MLLRKLAQHRLKLPLLFVEELFELMAVGPRNFSEKFTMMLFENVADDFFLLSRQR
jgi:hypothetical protein